MGSPRLCYGSLQPSPDTLTRFKGLLLRGEKGREMEGEERKKKRAGERGGEVCLPHSKFLDPPLIPFPPLFLPVLSFPVLSIPT